VESSDDAIIGSRLEGVIESWNRGAERLFGYTAQEVVGRQLSILVPDELQAGLAERSRRVSEGESIEPFVTTRKHKDGRLIPVEIKISSVINSEGTIVRRAAMVRDLTERMRVERALAESEEKLRAVVELAPDAVFMASQGRFFMVNQAACDQLGYSREQLMQLKVRDIVAPRFVENVVSRLNGKLLPGVHESAHLRADGVEVPVEANFAKILFRGELIVMGIARDISARKRAEAERKELEELLHQAQKMEAVGRLAGGVAHEFNNLLMVIQSYAETLHEELPAYGGLRNNTREIVKAVARASSLTHQMLAFSRKQVLTPALLDLNAVIRDAAKMLTRLIGEDVELQTKPGAGLWAVEADAGQIVQMLMNLTANARDAMPRGGQLTITTGNLSVEKGIAGARESLVPGDYAWLSVADTGMGFSSEVKEHIFEPFFTTKEVGQGTGLGLATVYGIVKQSGGYIHAYGEPGKGACFTIYLPRAMGTVPVAAAVKAEAAPTGAETLLVVEDEEAVRQVICEYLRRQGYAVLSAENTQQALAVAGECKGMIDPLITDLVMPGQSGLELARKLTGLRPGMKTIYMSGHADDAIARHGVDRMEAIFLQKPFSMSTLARKVREALNEAGTVQ